MSSKALRSEVRKAGLVSGSLERARSRTGMVSKDIVAQIHHLGCENVVAKSGFDTRD